MLSQEKGFSMVELVVVIVLIGILSAFALPRMFQSFDDAHAAAAQKFAASIGSGLNIFRADYLLEGNRAAQYQGFLMHRRNAMPLARNGSECERIAIQVGGLSAGANEIYVHGAGGDDLEGFVSSYAQYMTQNDTTNITGGDSSGKAYREIYQAKYAIGHYGSTKDQKNGGCAFWYIGDPVHAYRINYYPSYNPNDPNISSSPISTFELDYSGNVGL